MTDKPRLQNNDLMASSSVKVSFPSGVMTLEEFKRKMADQKPSDAR